MEDGVGRRWVGEREGSSSGGYLRIDMQLEGCLGKCIIGKKLSYFRTLNN